jgi:hypothetical protein
MFSKPNLTFCSIKQSSKQFFIRHTALRSFGSSIIGNNPGFGNYNPDKLILEAVKLKMRPSLRTRPWIAAISSFFTFASQKMCTEHGPNNYKAVLRIRIRRIHIFLGLPDPDPYGSGSFYHHVKIVGKTLFPAILYCFWLFNLWKIM